MLIEANVYQNQNQNQKPTFNWTFVKPCVHVCPHNRRLSLFTYNMSIFSLFWIVLNKMFWQYSLKLW